MKQLSLLFASLTLFVFAQAQQAVFEQNSSNTIKVFDNVGRAFENPADDIQGFPYFLNDWKPGFITMKDGKVYARAALRLDIVKHEVHYLGENNVEMFLPAVLVAGLTINDSVSVLVKQYKFASGFPAIDNQDVNFYYRVLSAGNLTLLCASKKQVHVSKDPLSGAVDKSYQLDESYYFYQSSVLTRLKKNKEGVLELMKNHTAEMEAFISSQKISFKSINDIVKLVNYYNSLP